MNDKVVLVGLPVTLGICAVAVMANLVNRLAEGNAELKLLCNSYSTLSKEFKNVITDLERQRNKVSILQQELVVEREHKEFVLSESDRYPCFDLMWRFSKSAVLRIMREVEQRDMALALAITTQQVCDKIRSNCSTRYWALLCEEKETILASNVATINYNGVCKEAKDRITAQIRRLHEAGEITLEY